MQKVEGSSPFIRSEISPAQAGFLFARMYGSSLARAHASTGFAREGHTGERRYAPGA
jgi:hypothetical protein